MKKHRNKMKKWMAAGIALVMFAGGSTAVYADHQPPGLLKKKQNEQNKHNKQNKQNNKWKQSSANKKRSHIKLNFSDLHGLDWARKHIANLAAMRIFEGYDDGTFRPHKPVTRLEAVITAVRLMDLREEAEAANDSNLNFKDANIIQRKYPQAVGYVAVAAENNLFIETEDRLQPESAASRLWVATMLVKALGLEDEALKKMNTKLDFKDANAIPAGSVGYVAVAVEKGIIYGYDNGTFQPNKPVTRAEIAAFLDRTGQHLPDFQRNSDRGELLWADSDELTIFRQGQIIQLPLADDVFIVRGGKQIRLSDLKRGEEVYVRTYEGEVILIEALGGADDDDAPMETDAFVAEVSRVSDGVIRLNHDGRVRNYPIAKNAAIRLWNGKQGRLSDVQRGSSVFVRVEDGAVTFIHVLEYEMQRFEGTLAAMPDDKSIYVYRNGEIQQYRLADDVKIIRNDVEAKPSDLTIRDVLEVQIRGGEAAYIDVKEPARASDALSATIAAPVSGGVITLKTKDHLLQYKLDNNAFIQKGSVQIDADELKAGDKAEVQLLHNRVVAVKVTDQSSGNMSFEATLKDQVKDGRISLLLDGLTLTYELADDVQVYRNDRSAGVKDLRAGDEVVVLVIDEKAILIHAKSVSRR